MAKKAYWRTRNMKTRVDKTMPTLLCATITKISGRAIRVPSTQEPNKAHNNFTYKNDNQEKPCEKYQILRKIFRMLSKNAPFSQRFLSLVGQAMDPGECRIRSRFAARSLSPFSKGVRGDSVRKTRSVHATQKKNGRGQRSEGNFRRYTCSLNGRKGVRRVSVTPGKFGDRFFSCVQIILSSDICRQGTSRGYWSIAFTLERSRRKKLFFNGTKYCGFATYSNVYLSKKTDLFVYKSHN